MRRRGDLGVSLRRYFALGGQLGFGFRHRRGLGVRLGVGLPNIKRMADLKTASAQADNKTVDLFAGADGFAEVFPEDKYTVVKHLQAAGHVSGMTGDGVNDAPAFAWHV